MLLVNLEYNAASLPFSKVATTGDWTLYGITLNDFGLLTVGDPFTLEIGFKIDGTIYNDILIDDVRVEPGDAQMTCFVYDRDNLRLLTVFDNQHLGLYYQYNDEGKLIRKLRETERGLKMLEETQYHQPLVARP